MSSFHDLPAPDMHPRTHPEIYNIPVDVQRTPTAKESTTDDTVPFRPVLRPPMAVLHVLDDGKSVGQAIRLRTDTFTIGRTEGDLTLPQDGMISRKHVTITRKAEKGRMRWVVEDLKSQNGTFVRVSDAVLSHDQVILLGSRRYKFNAAPNAATAAPPAGEGTQGWKPVQMTDLFPSLVELHPDGGKGTPVLLREDEVLIGRGPGCGVTLTDSMVSPRHARLYKNPRGEWVIENLNSLNGTWVQVDSLTLDQSGQFLIGEQRFTLQV